MGNQATGEEERGLHDDVVHDVEHHGGEPGQREQPERQHHVADLADDVERQDPLHVLLGDGTEDANDHREHGDDQDQSSGPNVGVEQQGLGPNDGVDTDLGQQPGEDRGHGRRSGRVAVRQPEVEGEHGCLDAEDDEQQRRQTGLRTPGDKVRICSARSAMLTVPVDA